MSEQEGGGESKFLTGFLLGFLVGVLIALGVGASLVMVGGRRQAIHAEMAMRDAEARAMAEEQQARAEQERAKALDAFKVQNDLAAQLKAAELEKHELAAQLKDTKEKLAEGKAEVLGDPNVEREDEEKKDE